MSHTSILGYDYGSVCVCVLSRVKNRGLRVARSEWRLNYPGSDPYLPWKWMEGQRDRDRGLF